MLAQLVASTCTFSGVDHYQVIACVLDDPYRCDDKVLLEWEMCKLSALSNCVLMLVMFFPLAPNIVICCILKTVFRRHCNNNIANVAQEVMLHMQPILP